MAILSIVATGFSIWAVLLLRHTLDESRKATDAANKAAEHARIANLVADETATIERRPWISIEGNIRKNFYFGQGADSLHNIFNLVLRNIGKTPALDIHFSWKIHFENTSHQIEYVHIETAQLIKRVQETLVAGRILTPNQSVEIPLGVAAWRKEIEAQKGYIEEKRFMPWISIAIIYRDFKRNRWYQSGLTFEVLSKPVDGLHRIVISEYDNIPNVDVAALGTGLGVLQ